jgi:hypothetical protein
LSTGTLAIDATQNGAVETYPSVHPTRRRRSLSCSSGGAADGCSRVRGAARTGNERYQSILISSQQNAIIAAIKHQRDARFQATNTHETRTRETKDKCDGMLHTRLRCKQQKKRVVDDEIGMSGQGQGKRGEAAEQRWW